MIDPVIDLAKLKLVALPVTDIIAIGVFGGLQTPNLGEEEGRRGRGWYHSKEHW